MLVLMSPEQMVPKGHLAPRIEKLADEALRHLSLVFDPMHSGTGRLSIRIRPTTDVGEPILRVIA